VDTRSRSLCYKQAETDDGGDLLDRLGHAAAGMITAGWTVTGTWPIHTSGPDGHEISVPTRWILDRPGLPTAAGRCGVTDRRGLIAALREEFPRR